MSGSDGQALAATVPSHFDLTPAVGGPPVTAPICQNLVPHGVPVAPPGLGQPLVAVAVDPENFLASRRVRIGRTNFDQDWTRVRSERVSRSALRRVLGEIDSDRSSLLSRVNSRVNRQIEYTEDSAQYGKADYWAGARRTLRSGRGDCEDIALTKMQLLRAAGIPAEDMILTIARDLVRNADHAVLIVRNGEGYAMLDNATDTVLDATPGHDYRPILSFGSTQTWLHGS